MIGETLSHYRILEQLGKGGMGEVYLAEDTTLKRKVALKVLPPELATSQERLERFQREAESLASLNHPNIVTIHTVEEDGGVRFLTMEWVEGQTLADLMGKGGIPLERIFEIATPLADALAVAHSKGVVHRDLKPGNVMVTEDGRVKVLDFGLAKLLEEEPDLVATEMATEALTREGIAMGTIPYMSPEQVQGKAVDHRSDIFSLGIVLYEMSTGKLPFEGETSADLISSILRDNPDSVTDLRLELPRHFGRIIRHCLEKDPQRRYQSALDVRNEIEGLQKEVESGEVPVSRATAATPVTGAAASRKWLALFALVAAVAVVGGLAWWMRGDREPEASQVATAPEEVGRQMMVVLPFENLGAPEDEFFAAGMTEEITTRLAAVSGLGVISRNSAMRYAGTDKTIQQIGEELGVQYVLEGTVRWARTAEGSRVRISPQLIHVADDTNLWADTYDRVIDDVFEVQSDIAGEVINQLGVALLEPEQATVEAQHTENMEAYQAYLRGLDQTGHLTYSEEDRMTEIEMFERAVELDPEFAEAWAELSTAHSGLINLGMDKSPARLALAKAAVDRALELDPDLPDAHLALAYYYYWGLRDYTPALEALAIAERSMPDDQDVLIANFAIRRRQGRLDESLESVQRAFELSPLEDDLPREIGVIHMMNRDPVQALESFDESIALAPDQQAAYMFKMLSHWALGDVASARQEFERMPQTPGAFLTYYQVGQDAMERNWNQALVHLDESPADLIEAPDVWTPLDLLRGELYLQLGDEEKSRRAYESALEIVEQQLAVNPQDARLHSSLGLIYAGMGMKEEAIREGREAVRLYPPEKDALHGPTHVEDLARIYTMVGEYDEALEQIDRFLSLPTWTTAEWVDVDPRYDALREHPRYEEVLGKHRAK
jgi:TolB-like protein/tRNA A-37 threonylcarbamoyl transferase component Bud32/Flp pilus assembly protein TadD